MDFILLIAMVTTIGLFFYSLYLLAFRRGKRRKGAWILAGSFAATAISGNFIANQQLEKEGWASFSEKADAADAGITDPTAWASIQAATAEKRAAEHAKLEAEARKRAEEEAAAAAMAAAEQERLAQIEADQRAAAEKAESERLAAETKAAEEEEAAKAEERAARQAHEKRHGFHCLSGWDGSHRGLVTEVKRRLNDPRSFEHAETRTWPVTPEGRNQILMTYRARNGFGAMMLGKAVGTFDNETCDIDVESID